MVSTLLSLLSKTSLPSSGMEATFPTADFVFYFCCFNGIPRPVTSHNTVQKAELFFQSFKVYADFDCFNFWLHIRTSGTTSYTHFSWSNLPSESCWLIMFIILATSELLNSHHCTQTSVNFQCFHWFLWVFGWLDIISLCTSLWLPRKLQCH